MMLRMITIGEFSDRRRKKMRRERNERGKRMFWIPFIQGVRAVNSKAENGRIATDMDCGLCMACANKMYGIV
jgi:hypothetical protein